ncbi:MAG: pentapeptide repeat-containing protein, partial [Planktothrix sp.]
MKKINGCFNKKELTEINLNSCDIRGLMFHSSIINKGNFQYSIAGLSARTKYINISAGLFCLVVCGIGIGWPIFSIVDHFFLQKPNFLIGVIGLLIPVIFVTTLIYKEFKNTLVIFTVSIFNFIIVLMAILPGDERIRDEFIAPLLFILLIDIGFIAGFNIFIATTTALRVIVDKKFNIISSIVFFLLPLISAMFSIIFNRKHSLNLNFLLSYLLIAVFLFVAIKFSEKAIQEEKKYLVFKTLAINLCSMKGTNLSETDLTDADFTGAILGNTNFSKANLTRTCWKNALYLDRARVEGTYLENERIRQLLVTGNGRDQNFDGLDLRGCNLRNADLTDASFINAKLSEA